MKVLTLGGPSKTTIRVADQEVIAFPEDGHCVREVNLSDDYDEGRGRGEALQGGHPTGRAREGTQGVTERAERRSGRGKRQVAIDDLGAVARVQGEVEEFSARP